MKKAPKIGKGYANGGPVNPNLKTNIPTVQTYGVTKTGKSRNWTKEDYIDAGYKESTQGLFYNPKEFEFAKGKDNVYRYSKVSDPTWKPTIGKEYEYLVQPQFGETQPLIDTSRKPLVIGQSSTYNPNTDKYYADPTMKKELVVQDFNKGGKVKKAPCMNKGGKVKGYENGGEIRYDASGRPITSSDTLPLTSGTEFKTQGDMPLTTAQGQPDGQQKQKGGGFMSSLGSSMGWMQPAMEAQQTVRGMVDKNTIVDPKTGKTYSQAKTKDGAIVEAVAKPAHETWMEDIKSGNNKQLAADIFLTPLGGNIIRGKGGFQDPEFEKNRQRINQEQGADDALAARERGETSYVNKGELYRKEEQKGSGIVNNMEGRMKRMFADGGKIVGKGTAKSDSIDATIKEDSFIVPVENEKVAATIRKVVLKKAPTVKANLKQKGGEKVRLSDGEHLFTPEENEKLKSVGIDLNTLAPNAENKNSYKDGGKVSKDKISAQIERYKRNNPSIKGTKEYDNHIKELSDESNWEEEGGEFYFNSDNGHEKRKAAYQKTIDEGTKKLNELNKKPSTVKPTDEKGQGVGKVSSASDKLKKIPSMSGTNVDKLDKQTSNPKLGTGKPKLTAPKGVKTASKPTSNTSGITNENYVSPQDRALMEDLKKKSSETANPTGLTTSPLLKSSQSPNVGIQPEKKTEDKTGKPWGAWKPSFGSAIEGIGSMAQIGLGLKALEKAGARPVDKIDPTFQSNVDKAQAQSNYGFTPEESFMINQQNQNATNAARFAARNYSGGNAGNAFNMERSAINEGFGRGLQSAVANRTLQLNKQEYATNLALQKANMSRNLFGDKMTAWMQNQQSGGALVGQGIQNGIGAARYANELQAQKERQAYYNS